MALHGKLKVIEFFLNDGKLATKICGSGSGYKGVDRIWIFMKKAGS